MQHSEPAQLLVSHRYHLAPPWWRVELLVDEGGEVGVGHRSGTLGIENPAPFGPIVARGPLHRLIRNLGFGHAPLVARRHDRRYFKIAIVGSTRPIRQRLSSGTVPFYRQGCVLLARYARTMGRATLILIVLIASVRPAAAQI